MGPLISISGKASKVMATMVAAYRDATAAAIAAAASQQTQTASMVAGEIAQVSLTSATKASTAAQVIWNATVAANPIGAAVLALGALVAVVTVASAAISQATNAEDDYQRSMVGVSSSIREAIDAHNELMSAISQADSDLSANIKRLYEDRTALIKAQKDAQEDLNNAQLSGVWLEQADQAYAAGDRFQPNANAELANTKVAGQLQPGH